MASFTREAIIRSFLRLLDERPLNKITVRDIVEDCGVNRNTFYYHFEGGIPALVEAVSKGEIDRLLAQNERISSMSEALDVATAFICRHRRAVLHLYNSSNRDIYERYLMEITRYTARRYFDTAFPDADLLEGDLEIVVLAYASESYGLIVEWLNRSLDEGFRATLRRLCELRAGTIETMIHRSAQDREKQAN